MKIQIIKSIWDEDSLESRIIFKNDTNKTLQFIKIEARFYDKDENVIDLGEALIGDKIPPHSETVQILNYLNIEVNDIASYNLRIAQYKEK